MKKSMVIGSVLTLSLCIASPAFATNPTDVPAKHWSYDAVNYLVQAGIVDGYSDGTFRGDKTMSRYEMAQVVYKAMLSESKANIAQKALIDKLASEYALEMNKIESMDSRLTKVEKNATVKFSGSLLDQYKIKRPAVGNGWQSGQWQVRLNASAQVDESTTFNLRLANPTPTAAKFKASTANYWGYNGETNGTNENAFRVDRFFATTKTGATNITVGRQAMELDQEDIIIDSGFFSFDGVKIAGKIGAVEVDAKRGRFARGVTGYTFGSGVTTNAADFNNIDIDSIMIGSKTGKLAWDASWAKFSEWKPSQKTLMNYYTAGVKYGFNDKLSMTAEVGKNDAVNGGNFWYASAKYGAQSLNTAGKQNFTVGYLHAGLNSVNGIYTSFDQPTEDGNDGTNGHSWNNLDLAYRYAFSKQWTGKLEFGKVMDTVNSANDYHFWKTQFIYKF